jgi:hypothetical protein
VITPMSEAGTPQVSSDSTSCVQRLASVELTMREPLLPRGKREERIGVHEAGFTDGSRRSRSQQVPRLAARQRVFCPGDKLSGVR